MDLYRAPKMYTSGVLVALRGRPLKCNTGSRNVHFRAPQMRTFGPINVHFWNHVGNFLQKKSFHCENKTRAPTFKSVGTISVPVCFTFRGQPNKTRAKILGPVFVRGSRLWCQVCVTAGPLPPVGAEVLGLVSATSSSTILAQRAHVLSLGQDPFAMQP